jgi:hypothetical protein
MGRGTARHFFRALALTALIAVLGIVATAPVAARPATGPTVDIEFFAGLAPDGGSISVQVLASCPERWTVVEAAVAVSQPQASGRASFPLTCIGSVRPFRVVVPASVGTFQLAPAQVTASVVIQRGRTEGTQDSKILDVQPTVLVELGETARLENGGEAVVIDVTVACPVGTRGLQSRVNVSQQGRVSGNGVYTPVCDATRHTFSVRVEASSGTYQTGIAQALTFADIEFGGMVFSGVDDDGALEIVS